VFNVVIEKELNIDIDPLIIKEDLNDIIQSIEEQLYNINVSYRNHFRKIKNNIKLLEGISESQFIFLEDDNINDENLIQYLSNVLEISLDCVIATLYEDQEYKTQLSTVTDLKDLFKINNSNIDICKNIFEECNSLFNVYSEVNNKTVSSTSFYEIIDESINRSINHNKNIIPISKEDEIYKLVIENLDYLVCDDLNTTFNNIKQYVAVIEGLAPQPIGGGGGGNNGGGGGGNNGGGGGGNRGGHNPNNPPDFGIGAGRAIPRDIWDWVVSLWHYFVTNATAGRVTALLTAIGGLIYLGSNVVDWFRNILAGVAGASIFDRFSTNIDIVKDPAVRAVLKKLTTLNDDENGLFKLKNILTFKGPFDPDRPVFSMLSEKEINIITNYVNTIKNYDNATPEVLTIQNIVEKYGGSLGVGGNTSNSDYLYNLIASLKAEAEKYKTGNIKLEMTAIEKTAKLTELNNKITLAEANHEFLKQSNVDLQKLRDSLNDNVEDARNLIENSVLLSTSIAGATFIILILGAYILKKRSFTNNSLSTIKMILALRKKIDALRSQTLSVFPELKIQFTFIDSEVKKCEQESNRKNDILLAYQCSMKYFIGSYALIMYSTMFQLTKDGISMNNFNKLSDIHNFNGFASLKTRTILKDLNSFYDLMIEYDPNLVNSFETVFYFLKKQILENKGSDNIIKNLPVHLTTGRD